uniref:Uncharacterized protein n=1 Tax=Arundo donax TaxID=35708 RepID=A0A0A8YYK0_ARUDO
MRPPSPLPAPKA